MEIESNDYKLRKSSTKSKVLMVTIPPQTTSPKIVKTKSSCKSKPIKTKQPSQKMITLTQTEEQTLLNDIKGDEVYFMLEEEDVDGEFEENTSDIGEDAEYVVIDNTRTKSEPKSPSKIPKTESTFDCSTCSKVFKKSNQLKVHMRCHTNERPFICTVTDCGKSFRLKHHLNAHQRYHDLIKPFSCQHCDKLFTEHSSLLRHTKIHTNDKRYVCMEKSCGKAFITPSDLRKHSNCHSGLKPYSCKIVGCNKSYSCPSSLCKHKKKHLLDAKEEV